VNKLLLAVLVASSFLVLFGSVQEVYGGLNWTPQTSGTTKNLRSIDFVDANIGYAIGAAGTILGTTDGGNTWIAQMSGTSSNLQGLDTVNANTAYVVGFAPTQPPGADSTILKTIDGGGYMDATNIRNRSTPTFSGYD